MNKDHLVPDLIKDLVARFKAAKMQNEKFSLEDRLNAIKTYIEDGLNSKTNIFKKR